MRAILLGSLLLAVGAQAHSFTSPDKSVSVKIECGAGADSCRTLYTAGSRSGEIKDFAGQQHDRVSIHGIGQHTAQVTLSLGSYDSISFLVDNEKGLLGPYQNILAVDEHSLCAATMSAPDTISFVNARGVKKPVKVSQFNPKPMSSATFLSVAENAQLRSNVFSVEYVDAKGGDQTAVVQQPCAE